MAKILYIGGKIRRMKLSFAHSGHLNPKTVFAWMSARPSVVKKSVMSGNMERRAKTKMLHFVRWADRDSRYHKSRNSK